MKDQLILVYSYLHGVWGYRWSALVIAWIVALLGWVGVYALPDRYTSLTTIHIETKSIIKPLLKGLAVESDIKSGLAIMRPLLLSRENLLAVIRATDMDLNLDKSSPEEMDRFVEKFARSITLTQKKKSDIYELSYEGSSAELAYKVVSKLLNTLIENTLSSARTDTAEAQVFLNRQIDEYEKRLSEAEEKLAEFKRENVGLMPDKTGGYYNKLQGELGAIESIRSELQLAETRYSEMQKQIKGEMPLLGDNYGSKKVLKLRKYREQLESLLSRYTEQHPDVQALRTNIAETLADDGPDDEFVNIGAGDTLEMNPVYQELKADLHRQGVEVETLKLKLMEKQKKVEALKKSVDIIPEVEAKLAKLNRGYEITRERYLSLVERRESAQLAQEVGQSGNNISFQIIDPPRVPTQASGPKRLILLSAIFIVAIAAGLGWGFFRYHLQPTFISPSQISSKFNHPVLGSAGLFMTAEHKRNRMVQLTSFLLVFSLLAASYGGAMFYSKAGSHLVSNLISSRSSTV
ncbi:MAG: hypothetical protein LJE83_06690 [Gammaproteobacteria bacterium]|nr:hypothetical protein [Gammaproteobacteria bacterium]